MADMPGEITGGTECYGRRYSCDDPLTSLALMFLKTFQVAFSRGARLVALVTQRNTLTTNCP
jgi:hypothetical protein